MRVNRKSRCVCESLFRKRHYRDEAFNLFHCDEYLLKPIDFAKLAAAMDRLAPFRPSGTTADDSVVNG